MWECDFPYSLNGENLNRGDKAHTVSSCSCQGEVSARVCNQFIALVPTAAEKHRARDGTRSSHTARGYTARSNNHGVGVRSLPGRLRFTSHLLRLLLLMEHVLMVKAALSPQPRRETYHSLAFVKSPAEGFTVCQRPRHPHGEAQEGGIPEARVHL